MNLPSGDGLLNKFTDKFSFNTGIRNIVRSDYGNDLQKVRKFENIRKFFDMKEKCEYTLDDQTWEDLDMNKVYSKVDRTYSSVGESVLYSMLRNPLMDEEKLIHRSTTIDMFKSSKNLREKLLSIFFNLSKDKKNTFLDMIENQLITNKAKYYLYTFLGKVLPLIIILISIFISNQYMMGLLILSFLNMFINNNERKNIKSYGMLYLRRIIKSSRKIANIKDKNITDYTDKINRLLKEIKDIDRGTKFIGFANMWAGLFEFVSVIFLLEESAYYNVSSKIKEEKETLLELYSTIGEIEALISISNFQYNLEHEHSKPQFIKDIMLNIVDGIHPLIEEAVPNSININTKGIVLTGTNMSGKSTFLRMLGVNILFAQTFYFVLAKNYTGSFFNIVSSISPNDDLVKGKSFFMAEVESISRIINALEKEVPVFCLIDEIFRGTNPIERIAMSAEILKYLDNSKSISLVTTHDRELVDILKESYEFYYFSEMVDSTTGLSFDYKLKKGVSQTRNAIKLLEYMNYPKVIVENSYKRAEAIEGFV